jgi:hypothetical protein
MDRADAAVTGGVISSIITNYDPAFSFDPEADVVANYDIYGIWLAGTEAAVSLLMTDGTVNVTLACPKMQFKAIPEGDRDGIQIYDAEGQCNHDSGNDAVSLTAAAA